MNDDAQNHTLVLGIGNVLMGDEGVGVYVVRELAHRELPPGVECLDGGTGGFHLLGAMQDARRIIIIDATADGEPVGTVKRIQPRFSKDYPRTLTAHDIGLKDLLDAFHLFAERPEVVLFAVSIEFPQPIRIGLSPDLRAELPRILAAVQTELRSPRLATA